MSYFQEGAVDEWTVAFIETAQIVDLEPLLPIRGSHFIPMKECIADFKLLYD